MLSSLRSVLKSNGKGNGSATQCTVNGNGRAIQLAVNGKSCATGGETKTGKEATLPPLLGPNQDLVWKGTHSRFAWHLQRVAGSTVLAELILLTGSVKIDFLRHAFYGGSHRSRTPEVLDNWQPYNICKWMRAQLGRSPGLD